MADIPITRIKRDPRNPRKIDDAELERLKTSIKQFPKMMTLRPIIIDKTGKIIAGDKRYLACQALGYLSLPSDWVRKAADLTEEERSRFIAMDNMHSGTWDWDILKQEWDLPQLKEWGLTTPEPTTPVSFNAAKTEKGTQVKVKCKNTSDANALFERLLKEGFEVVIK